jgi:hypothetical protein
MTTADAARRVVILQSAYLPWRGYFDLIDDADLFVVYDDVQYTRRDWRNRNRIANADGVHWITVPVHFSRAMPTPIDRTPIDHEQPWARHHVSAITHAYARAPFFAEITGPLFEIICRRHASISELNVALIRRICAMLEIDTPIVMSRELDATGSRTDRLVSIMGKVGGTAYLSGPAARAYLELEQFERRGLTVEYKVYEYPPYPQLHGASREAMSIVDLLVMCGPDSRRYVKSLATPERAV